MKQFLRSLYTHYTAVSILYWFGTVCTISFSTAYMQEMLLSNTQIGFVRSCSAILSIGIPLATAALVDRFSRVSSKGVFLLLDALVIAGMLILQFGSPGADGIFILFSVIIGTYLSMCISLNTMALESRSVDPNVDFSVSRGIGSGVYALGMVLVGEILTRFSLSWVPALSLSVNILLFLITLPLKTSAVSDASETAPRAKVRGGYGSFIRENPLPMLVMLGTMLVAMCSQGTATFLINILENIGGSNREFGYYGALSAMCEVPVMLYYSRLSRRLSHRLLLAVIGILYVARTWLLYAATGMPAMYLASAITGPCFAILTLASVLYIDEVTPHEDRSKAQAIAGIATNGLSVILANSVCGHVVDTRGIGPTILLNLAFAFAGALTILYTLYRTRHSREESAVRKNS